MRRVSLKQQFTGEPTMDVPGGETYTLEQDQMDIEIQGGKVIVRVPSNISDEEAFKEEYFNKFVRLELKLEQGKTLYLWISEGAEGVDVRFE